MRHVELAPFRTLGGHHAQEEGIVLDERHGNLQLPVAVNVNRMGTLNRRAVIDLLDDLPRQGFEEQGIRDRAERRGSLGSFGVGERQLLVRAVPVKVRRHESGACRPHGLEPVGKGLRRGRVREVPACPEGEDQQKPPKETQSCGEKFDECALHGWEEMSGTDGEVRRQCSDPSLCSIRSCALQGGTGSPKIEVLKREPRKDLVPVRKWPPGTLRERRISPHGQFLAVSNRDQVVLLRPRLRPAEIDFAARDRWLFVQLPRRPTSSKLNRTTHHKDTSIANLRLSH